MFLKLCLKIKAEESHSLYFQRQVFFLLIVFLNTYFVNRVYLICKFATRVFLVFWMRFLHSGRSSSSHSSEDRWYKARTPMTLILLRYATTKDVFLFTSQTEEKRKLFRGTCLCRTVLDCSSSSSLFISFRRLYNLYSVSHLKNVLLLHLFSDIF